MTGTKAQLEITADASGVEAGVNKAKRSLADLGATAKTEGAKAAEGVNAMAKASDDAGNKLSANSSRVLKSLESQSNRLSLTTAEYAKLRAATAGVSDAAAPFIARIETATAPMAKLGISAGQTAAAMRGVPAQFTDIVTSLQGGQAPLTVFLQQGGQLKDMFGGIGPAARAMSTYIAALVTPLTIAAGAAGALAVAMFQGSSEFSAYAKALLLTGNYAGLTTDQLKGLAAQIAATSGTQGQAAEVLASLAGSGKIAAGSMAEVGTAVLAMNRVLGTSVDEATAVFVKLADEPTKASVKLNEAMHYLNLATYERIRALEDQGRKEEAAAVAMAAAATITVSRMGTVEAQAGVLSRAWRALAKDAKEAWDIMQGIGRQATTGEMLANAQGTLSARLARGPLNSLTGDAFGKGNASLQEQISGLSRKALREADNAYAEGERARTESAKIGASDRLKTLTNEVQTNADKRKKAIAELKRDFETLGKSTTGKEFDSLVANINDKFKDPKGGGGGGAKLFHDDAAAKFLETLRQTEASLSAQLAGENKLTAAQAEQVKFQQLIADLKEKKILTADQQSLIANKDAISVQLAKNAALSNEIEFEKKIADLVKESADSAKQFRQQIEGINISIASANDGRSDQQDRALAAFGLGDRARAEVEAQRSIRNEMERFQRQLTKQASDKGQLGSQEYKDEVEKIKAALDAALAAQSGYFDALKSKQADWKNGATTALQNYVDELENVSATVERALSGSFKGAEDALVEFVTTGKGSVKSLADSIIKDLARIAIQQSITKPLASSVLGLFGGAGADTAGFEALISSFQYKAGGGPVSGNTPYIVGEKGPELFVPGTAGNIVPNGSMGGGQTVNVVQNFTVGDVAGISTVRDAVANSEKRIAGMIGRSQRYGGAMA